jgi:hypothetical protein
MRIPPRLCRHFLPAFATFRTHKQRAFRFPLPPCRDSGGDVVTLAVLADLQADWKPDTYRYSRLGCEVMFRFPVCKLLEILPSLEEDTSLPALAAKAQIAAIRCADLESFTKEL